MEKIAMKCTREQYESIKEFIGELKDTSIGDFVKYNYLVNNYSSRVHSFGMLQEPADFRLKYETFDKDIFLKACGIVVKKEKSNDMLNRAIELLEQLDRQGLEINYLNADYGYSTNSEGNNELSGSFTITITGNKTK